jgi:hypothetical protein
LLNFILQAAKFCQRKADCLPSWYRLPGTKFGGCEWTVLTHPGKVHSELAIGTQWLRSINVSLSRDRILTNKTKFGPLSFNKKLVLNTWSGLLLNEESLPDDWTYEKEVLVGIQPYTVRNGIG